MSKVIVTAYDVTTGYHLSRQVRIAHVSDLHERRCTDILAAVRDARPDLIVITGDTLERYDNRPQYDFDRKPIKRLIINVIHYTNALLNKLRTSRSRPNERYAFEFLRQAVRIAPVYMSLGNHEQRLRDSDRRFLQDQGVTLLDNADVTVPLGGVDVCIGGMSSWDYEPWLERYTAKKGCKLLLCHHPERFVTHLQDTDIALTLSGHTHGGQIRTGRKGRGFFVPGQGLFGRYAHGMFFDGRLIVSAGCSNTVAFPRLCNPREVVIVTMR